MAIRRIDPGSYLSRAVLHGNTVYLAGLTADDLSQDVAGQTRQILTKIDRYLNEAGTDKSKLLSAHIWLRDIATFDDMNRVWESWIDGGNPPARATVEARLAGDRYLIEIMVTAALD
jgi:enamine deaminase RidA (YjgF/YER057c/UK114 family)